MSIEISQGERLFAVGILLQWFWSSVALTGNETSAVSGMGHYAFWSSVALTGNETNGGGGNNDLMFWSSVALTGNETYRIDC